MTNNDARSAWQDVADRLEALALKFQLHAEEELSDDDRTVKSAFDRLGAAVQDAVGAVNDAVRDPAVRDDAREAFSALSRAITKTFDRR